MASRGSGGRIACARCGGAISSGYAAHEQASAPAGIHRGEPSSKPAPRTFRGFDDWKLDDDLHDARRLVRQWRTSSRRRFDDGGQADVAGVASTGDFHPLQDGDDESHRGDSPRDEAKSRSNLISWSVLSLGLAVFACGGALLGWSFATGRPDLWSLGLPLALAGQAGLIIGLALQLDALWRSNRKTGDTLENLDERLHNLKRASSMLSEAAKETAAFDPLYLSSIGKSVKSSTPSSVTR